MTCTGLGAVWRWRSNGRVAGGLGHVREFVLPVLHAAWGRVKDQQADSPSQRNQLSNCPKMPAFSYRNVPTDMAVDNRLEEGRLCCFDIKF